MVQRRDVCIPVHADISIRSINLRSAERGDMLCHGPLTRTCNGRLSFHVAAPVVWNALPVRSAQHPSVEDNAAGLKNHLFNQAYDILWRTFFMIFVLRMNSYCTYLLTYLLPSGAGPKLNERER